MSANDDISSVRKHNRIDGYNLAINSTNSDNSLLINYRSSVRILKITFNPTESNIGDTFDLAWQSVNSVAIKRMVVNPNSTGMIITLLTSQRFNNGWRIVISRNGISTVLGEIIKVEYSNTFTNPQVILTIDRNTSDSVPVIFQTEGINLINYNIPLMSNITMVDTTKIIYEPKYNHGSYYLLNRMKGKLRKQIINAQNLSEVKELLKNIPIDNITHDINEKQLVLTYNTISTESKMFVFYIDLVSVQ